MAYYLDATATRRDIEEILEVLHDIIDRFDDRFNNVEKDIGEIKADMRPLVLNVSRLETDVILVKKQLSLNP